MDITKIHNSDFKEVIFQPNKQQLVTPNDDVDNVPNCPLFIGVGGNITVLFEKDLDSEALAYTVPNGYVLVGRIRRVLASGTDCTQIRALSIC